MARTFAHLSGRGASALLILIAAIVATLGSASQALATPFTPGDVVVFRVGTGSETLSHSAATVWLDEYAPSGSLVESLELPTSASGANKPLLASGSSSSEGLLTLSGNDAYLMLTGYDTTVGKEEVAESSAKTVPRTVGRISATGEINTSTILENFANANNPRSATSSEGTKIWVGGAGKTTTGGVHYTTLGAHEASTVNSSLNETDTDVRQVSVVDGQLYTSANPLKAGALTIATVGSGLPTAKGTTIANLTFAAAPQEPYAYSLLTLGSGTTPDTLYVAEYARQAIVKYGLIAGIWVEEGSVGVPYVTGVTTNDVNGVVNIYATSSGKQGYSGSIYKFTDESGLGGTLSAVPVEIAQAPANEAIRGVAFAPGTTIGSGGTPPPAPTLSTSEETLPAALGDPTNATLGLTVGDPIYQPGELTVTVRSSNGTVAPQSGIKIHGSGTERTLSVTPAAVGESKLTITVEAPDGASTSTLVTYAVSENTGDTSDRYYAGAGNCSSTIDVGNGYMICGDDEVNVLHLYHERGSGEPVKSFNFNSALPYGATEMDIEASARAGNTLYWMGSASNSHHGEPRPATNVVFAATITGLGANTELTYLGSYTHLREDLIEWDDANGGTLGFAASTEVGAPSDLPSGFNIEGLEFAAGSSSEAYVAFRAPLEPVGEGPEDRDLALLVPVKNFSSLVTDGNPGSAKAIIGTPIEWNLGVDSIPLGIREIRRNAENEYLVIAGSADGSDSAFGLYGWDGEPDVGPVLLKTAPTIEQVAEGAWESIVSVPEPTASGDEVELLEDNGDTIWYENGQTSKNGLQPGLQKDLGRPFTVEVPTPEAPGAPALSQGANPNSGQFTLRWKPSPTLHPTFTLQHQNAQGGWTTVASGIQHREYTFTAGSPETEGTWTYRVSERNRNESGVSGYSAESVPIKVDRTAPYTPSAAASRAPDYAGDGGWYKSSVTVSFTANGDPVLADGSPGSAINPATLTASETFEASGSHEACGTVADNAGNVSAAGCETVQVEATPPTLEISCPATALVGETGVTATVGASDEYSGLASDPSGTVPIDTSVVGPQTITRTAVSNVGLEATKSCTTEVVYPTPGTPALTAGASPDDSGRFTLGWAGDDPLRYLGLGYTLQHHDAATETWSLVASGIEALSYAFAGAGEEEGTWVYRVQGVDTIHGQSTTYSPASASVVVDETPPYAPSAHASRPPEYAGDGGWYNGSVKVSFSSGGDPHLADASPGSGVNPTTLSGTQTLSTSGSHEACGTVADNAGNVSAPGCLTVQVEATPPDLEVSCPATALVGEAGVTATVVASDAYSGLASDPSGTFPIHTSQAGAQTITRTAVSNVGLETTRSCTTEVVYPSPGTPTLTVGTSPKDNGRFALGWTGADPLQYFGIAYTLQGHNAATQTWSTVASGIEELGYAFIGAGEGEGTWVYRVQGTDPARELTTPYSPDSAPVVIDETPPYAPSTVASRAPDYAGAGGWYKGSVQVSFGSDGDPQLADGSPGSGVNPGSIPASQTFDTSGSHTACGTVTDNVGNVSAPGCETVQVDATPPSVEISCPATALAGSKATATFTASDGQSGLAGPASGSVPIDTAKAGLTTTSTTAVDNVGNEASASCTTDIDFSHVYTGTVPRKLLVLAHESVELTSTAVAEKGISVEPGGAVDIEGATVRGALHASSPALIRVCAASVTSSTRTTGASGSVVIGEAHGCAPSTLSKTVTISGNAAGVLIYGNTFGSSLKVTGNAGGTSVTSNKVAGSLTVTGNTGTVVDRPNEVAGKSKLQ